jgi:hypothetical protein
VAQQMIFSRKKYLTCIARFELLQTSHCGVTVVAADVEGQFENVAGVDRDAAVVANLGSGANVTINNLAIFTFQEIIINFSC